MQFKSRTTEQIRIATIAMIDIFKFGEISKNTIEEAHQIGITKPRLCAMARFIELKGPPEQFRDGPE